MYNNTFLFRIDINPEVYKDHDATPIPFNGGFLIELEQKTDKVPCPVFDSISVQNKGYYYIEVNISKNSTINDIVRIKRVHFKCKDCHKTFTPKLEGIDRRARISTLNKQQLMIEFCKNKTIKDIAEQYHISTMMAIGTLNECSSKAQLI